MSEKRSTVLLDHHLKQLKLPTMLREYASMAAACGAEGVDYATPNGGVKVKCTFSNLYSSVCKNKTCCADRTGFEI